MEEKVLFIGVEYGKNKNWLRFTGFVPKCDNSRKYVFEYCGTELYTTAIMTDTAKENLINCLNDDFGYPPFNLKNAKKIVGNYKDYYVEYV